jgi:SAM-dependent methyltransferase
MTAPRRMRGLMTTNSSIGHAVSDAFRGTLPSRYVAPPTHLWRHWFDARVAGAVGPGMAVLDVGSGRHPSIAAGARPQAVRYVGLDVDARELERAPEGSYDEALVADVVQPQPELVGRFDLAVSLFVFEHVRPLAAAIENVRAYLRPGGTMIAQLAGGRSVHGVANRVIPHRAARKLAHLAMRGSSYREADSVFPAHYDHCYESALRRTLRGWSEVEIVPQFTGAQYFLWSRFATAAYIGYEEWTYRRELTDLATWYLVVATR